MFDISPEKVAVLLIIALVVLGPGRLVDAARALAEAARETIAPTTTTHSEGEESTA